MLEGETRPGRRRIGGPRLADQALNVAFGADLMKRIDAAAERYGVAAAVVVRYAVDAGLRQALQRLAREMPREPRPQPAARDQEAGK